MRVFKYPLQLIDESPVRLPKGAKILQVHEQYGEVCLWALVDPSEKTTEKRMFRVAGTGHEIADIAEKNYIGTVHLNRGLFVFHVFECIGLQLPQRTAAQPPHAN